VSTLSRGTRQIVVAHLTEHGMKPPEIAAELGVSPETVRRDLHNAPPPTVAQNGHNVAAGEDGPTLLLRLDAPLREALAVLRAVHNGPDTEEQNRAAARGAIRAMADHFREVLPEVTS
jgi:predicted transcriptional regulator